MHEYGSGFLDQPTRIGFDVIARRKRDGEEEI
jgi:hypothetical protein